MSISTESSDSSHSKEGKSKGNISIYIVPTQHALMSTEMSVAQVGIYIRPMALLISEQPENVVCQDF